MFNHWVAERAHDRIGEERWIDRPRKSTAQSSQDRVYYRDQTVWFACFDEVEWAAIGHGEKCSITKG